MKKGILIILATLLTGTVSFAQSFEWGNRLGTSVNLSCLVEAGTDISMVFPTNSGFDFGLGAGLRFSMPMWRKHKWATYTTEKVQTRRNYNAEFTLPLFVKLRYRFPSGFFLQTDAGYRCGLVALFDGLDLASRAESTFRGFFVEPQAGFRLNAMGTLSFGLTLQRYTRGEGLNTHTPQSVVYTYQTVTDWSPIAFVKYTVLLF